MTGRVLLVAVALTVAGCGGAAPTGRPLDGSTTTSAAVAGSSTSSTLASPSSSTTGAGQVVQLPVVACPTTFAITPPPASVALPASAPARIPAGSAGAVAVYSDSVGTMMVVAPSGWRCTALYGADGSGGVAVWPPGQAQPGSPGTWSHLPAGSAVEAVEGSETSACQGCALGQACALFAGAARDYQALFGRPCPTTRPRGELTSAISTGVVGFEDPPGVGGTASPSGGRYPANGVMTYYLQSVDGSWTETCTLPDAQHGICTAVLNAFVSSYGQR